MSSPRFARIASGALVAGGVALLLASGGSAEGWVNSLRCTGQVDAQAIDAQLGAAGSPLAGEGATFVREGLANDIDPRVLVAIAAQETMLMTYGPAQQINNPFGLGPGIQFATPAEAIAMAASALNRYADDGLVTLAQIGGRWAPVGATNDPQGLNGGWPAGVSTFFTTLGGDPYRPVQASAQDPAPTCAPAGATAAPAAGYAMMEPQVIPAVTPTDGPGVVVVWGGQAPVTGGSTMADGADPRTGRAAILEGFAFPSAAPTGSPITNPPAGARPVTIRSAPGAVVVAPVSGTLRIAEGRSAATGVGFWVDAPGRDRVGLGPLASYDPGIVEGVKVTAGQPLGRSTGSTAILWQRDGVPVAIQPMLAATRPSG
ncbi:MAG: hypothetical protein ACO3PB_00515 [Miltoncostaeaceae bacterium]